MPIARAASLANHLSSASARTFGFAPTQRQMQEFAGRGDEDFRDCRSASGCRARTPDRHCLGAPIERAALVGGRHRVAEFAQHPPDAMVIGRIAAVAGKGPAGVIRRHRRVARQKQDARRRRLWRTHQLIEDRWRIHARTLPRCQQPATGLCSVPALRRASGLCKRRARSSWPMSRCIAL